MRSLLFTDSAVELPALITIQRALTTLRWTTHREDVTISGNTWPAVGGAMLSSISCRSDGQENNCDVLIMAQTGGPVAPGDGARGYLDGWPISVKLFDPADPAGTATEIIPGAIVGSVAEDCNGMVTIAASGQLIKSGKYVTEHYSLTGREDLGDDRCKVPIMPADIGRGVAFVRPDIATGLMRVNDAYGRIRQASPVTGTPTDYNNLIYQCTVAGTTDGTTAPAYPTTAGGTVTDGTAQFIAVNSYTRHATGQAISVFEIQLDSLPDSRASDPSWYALGAVYIRSGNLNGFPKIPIRTWAPATLTATLFLPVALSDVPAGTQLEIHPGCDLTRDMCFARFNNIVNLRAETFVPPPEVQF